MNVELDNEWQRMNVPGLDHVLEMYFVTAILNFKLKRFFFR